MGGSFAVGMIAVVALLGGLRAATAVFLPLCVAYFSAVLLDPLVGRAERAGLPRKGGAVLATFLYLILIGGAIFACSQPFAKLYADLPKYQDKLRAAAAQLEHKARTMERRTRGVTGSTEEPAPPGVQKVQVVKNGGGEWSKYALAGVGSIAEAVGIAVFVPFLVLFLLMEKELLLGGVGGLLGRAFQPERIRAETNAMVRGYFLGNFVAAMALGAVQTGLFMLAGLENPVGLGIVTGFFNVVPIIGLPAALLPPLLQALTQQGGSGSHGVLVICGGIVVLHLFMANVVEPRWIANRVKLNSFVATLSMLFWGWGWGIVGFLLAIPLMAQLRIVLETSPDTADWAALLAQRPRARRHGLLGRWREAQTAQSGRGGQ